jgi:phage major head subunit gpT-like protein
VTPLQYTAFITTVDTTIGAIYQQLDPVLTWKEYAKEEGMTGGTQKAYGWTGMSPKPRPWFGSRLVYEEAPQTYVVTPIPYELTLGIDRFTLDDSDPNAMSIFWQKLPHMAQQWRRHPEYEIRDLIENAGVQTGARQNGLDGLTGFNTAHPIDYYNPTFNNGSTLFSGGTYCNDFIGTQTIGGTVIGGAMSTTAIATLTEYMGVIPSENGEALGVVPDAVGIPWTLRTVTDYVLRASLLAAPAWGGFSQITGQVGTADNMLAKQGMRIIVMRFLKKALRYYLMDLSHVEKPFGWVVREAPRTVPRVAESDPIVFDSHRYLWGGWDRVCPRWNYSWLFSRSGPTGA